MSVNAGLAEKAKSLGINFSEALETELAELIATVKRRQWLADNAEAIETYNEHVAQCRKPYGAFAPTMARVP